MMGSGSVSHDTRLNSAAHTHYYCWRQNRKKAAEIVARIPGVSSGVATVLARLAIRRELKHHRTRHMEFIVSVSGTNTSNAIFGLIALFIIGYPRGGAMVAVRGLVTQCSTTSIKTRSKAPHPISHLFYNRFSK